MVYLYLPKTFPLPSPPPLDILPDIPLSVTGVPVSVCVSLITCTQMAETGGGITVAHRIKGWFPERTQLHLAMLALQFGYAGFHVVSRAALNMGISKIVFPVYRNLLAFFLLLPFAYFLEK